MWTPKPFTFLSPQITGMSEAMAIHSCVLLIYHAVALPSRLLFVKNYEDQASTIE